MNKYLSSVNLANDIYFWSNKIDLTRFSYSCEPGELHAFVTAVDQSSVPGLLVVYYHVYSQYSGTEEFVNDSEFFVCSR